MSEIYFLKMLSGIFGVFFAGKFVYSFLSEIDFAFSFEHLVIGVEKRFTTMSDLIIAAILLIFTFI